MPFIQEQNEIRQDYKLKRNHSPVVTVLRTNTTKGLIFVLFFAIFIPLLFYYFVFDKGSYVEIDNHTCSVGKGFRVPCGKSVYYNSNNGNESAGVSEDYCKNIHCCYDRVTKSCFHYLPSKYFYYQQGKNEQGHYYYQSSLEKTPFGNVATKQLFVSVQELDENRLNIILDTQQINVFDVVDGKNYFINQTVNPMTVSVHRNNSNKNLVFTTADGPTIHSENYWEWSFLLSEEYLFGLGQTLIDLDENSTLTKVIYYNKLDHHTLPHFLAFQNGTWHGLMVQYNGPMEITVLPSNLVVLKGLVQGRITLELHLGPSVKDVILQQRGSQQVVKFWTLGVHICREDDASTLKTILKDYTNNYNFPYVSDCIHQNLLTALRSKNLKQNELDELMEILKNLKGNLKHFMLSLPPHIPVDSNVYNKTKTLDIFYKSNGNNYEGRFLNKDVVYPWFGHESISDFIQIQMKEIQDQLGGQYFPTNLVLNNNWPTDDSFEMDQSEHFVYLSPMLQEAMSSTLPWNLTIANELQQMVQHNQYGELQAQTFKEKFFVLTASRQSDLTLPVTVQNYDISWSNFRLAISTILFNSVLGSVVTGVPVCGSTANFDPKVHESLCMQWYWMAVTQPLFRISSDKPRRDPESLGTATATEAALQAIQFRQQMRYYFNTVLNYQREPLMRPMFYDFPLDQATFGLNGQYMVGGSLLFAHPMLPDKTKLAVYLPPSVEVWYEFWGGQAYNLTTRKDGVVEIDIVERDKVAFLAQGHIVGVTTNVNINGEMLVTLKIGLKLEDDGTWMAEGHLLVGLDLFRFVSTENELSVERVGFKIDNDDDSDSTKPLILSEIIINQWTRNDSLIICNNNNNVTITRDLHLINNTLILKYQDIC